MIVGKNECSALKNEEGERRMEGWKEGMKKGRKKRHEKSVEGKEKVTK